MNNLGGLALPGEPAPLVVGGVGIAPVAAPIPVDAARGGAGIAYPPGPIQADATRITTFTQYYSDPTKDPYHGNYERVMARFNAEAPGAQPPASLFQQVVSLGGNVPQAYLCCANTAQGPKIYCSHMPCKYVTALDGTPTLWDEQSFAFLGDVVRGLISIVMFENNAFEPVQAWAKRSNYILQHLPELQPILPPNLPDPDDAEIELITTRRYMFLPAVYVPLCLNANGFSPRQMWEILYPAIVQRQETEICAPLVRWLQVASTGIALDNPLAVGAPASSILLYAPPADEALLQHRHDILHRALPHLTAPAASLETALNQMAVALIAQTNDSRAAREQKTAQDLEPKLPSSRFTVTLPVLLEYLQVADERNLPDVWHRWANCTKRQEVQVLRDSLDSYARSAQAFSTAVPVVTTRLVQDLLTFNFVGQSTEDIQSGLHPFIIMDGNAEHRQTNAEVARLYGLLNSGDAACSLADLEVLAAKEVRSVPLSYWELEKNLGMFGNLLGVILGGPHPLTVAFRELWQLLQTNVKDDLHVALEYRRFVKPTHILRSIQLVFYTWFTHRRAHLTPPIPDLKTIVHQILMQIYILPNLPPALYHLAYPKKPNPHADANSLPSLVLSGTSTGSGASSNAGPSSSSNMSITSGASSVSGLTAATIPPPTRGSVVVNLTPNATLQTLLPPTIRIKDLIGQTSPPQLDSGGEMCLSYLIRNSCWSNCRRAAQHRANLTAAELQRLEQYLETQKRTYNTRRAASTSQGTAQAP